MLAPVPVPVGEKGGSGTSPGERGERMLELDEEDGSVWGGGFERGWPWEASFRRNSTNRLENDCVVSHQSLRSIVAAQRIAQGLGSLPGHS